MSIMSRRFSPASRRLSGQAMVEFALVMPLLLILLLAIFDAGRVVFAYNSITNAAREGARLAIVNQDAASVRARANGQVAIADTSPGAVTISFYKAVPNADPTTNDACSPLSAGCVVVVAYEATLQPITPIISNIVFSSGITLTATSMLPIEFVCPNPSLTASKCPRQP